MSKVAELMEDAIEISMEMIEENLERAEEDRHHPRSIALAAFPFVKRAAAKGRKQYTEEQKSVIIETFQIAMKYYGDVTGMAWHTSIDLTRGM